MGAGSEWPNPIKNHLVINAVANAGFTNSPYTDYDPTMRGYAGTPGSIKYFP